MSQRKTTGPRYAIRLRDLRGWHMLTVSCGRCRHKAHIRLWQLTSKLDGATFLQDAERRLVCQRCGNRTDNLVLITMMER